MRLSPSYKLPSMLLGLLQIQVLSLPEEMVEVQTIILNGNITTIMNGNHQCHCIKHSQMSFH